MGRCDGSLFLVHTTVDLHSLNSNIRCSCARLFLSVALFVALMMVVSLCKHQLTQQSPILEWHSLGKLVYIQQSSLNYPVISSLHSLRISLLAI